MPRDANGNYSLPPIYLAVDGQEALSSQHNAPLEDIAQALTSSLPRNGSAPMTGNLKMGGFKATGLADGATATDALTKGQFDAAIASLVTPIGTIGHFARSEAPAGWVKANGGTIGSPTSAATTRANADTEALFTLLWTQFDNTLLPIQTSAGVASTRGGSASADFAANKRLTIPDQRGEFVRGWDDGRGVDAGRALGSAQADENKSHTHTATAESAGAHTHQFDGGMPNGGNTSGSGNIESRATLTTGSAGAHTHPITVQAAGGTEARPRNIAWLACIKL